MTQNTLKTIIDAELEIAQMLKAERKRASAWLEQIKQATEQEVLQEIDRLADLTDRGKAAAREGAEKRAGEIIREATSLVERFETINEEDLQGVVWKYLRCILPGTEHDRSNVQN